MMKQKAQERSFQLVLSQQYTEVGEAQHRTWEKGLVPGNLCSRCIIFDSKEPFINLLIVHLLTFLLRE